MSADDEARLHMCATCGVSKADDCFTVCTPCWDHGHPRAASTDPRDAEIARLREQVDEATKQQRHAWERHAEKDRAYGHALAERDAARASLDRAYADINELRRDSNPAVANKLRGDLDATRLTVARLERELDAVVNERDSAVNRSAQVISDGARFGSEWSVSFGNLSDKLTGTESDLQRAQAEIERLTKQCSSWKSLLDGSVKASDDAIYAERRSHLGTVLTAIEWAAAYEAEYAARGAAESRAGHLKGMQNHIARERERAEAAEAKCVALREALEMMLYWAQVDIVELRDSDTFDEAIAIAQRAIAPDADSKLLERVRRLERVYEAARKASDSEGMGKRANATVDDVGKFCNALAELRDAIAAVEQAGGGEK